MLKIYYKDIKVIKFNKKILYIVAIVIFSFFYWGYQQLNDSSNYLTKLKLESIFSQNSKFELDKRKFMENLGGFTESAILFGAVDHCYVANKGSIENYIYMLSKYAKLGIYKAKLELLWLTLDKYNNEGGICPYYSNIQALALREMRDLFDNNFSNLIDWVPEYSSEFKSNPNKREDYIIAVLKFYYSYGYTKSLKEIINDFINKNDRTSISFLRRLEKELTHGALGRDSALLNLYRYLFDNVQEDKLKSYYSYKIAEAILDDDKKNVDAKNIMQDLASKGYGYAMHYLYVRNKMYQLPIETQINYLKRVKDEFDTGAGLVFERLAELYKDSRFSSGFYSAYRIDFSEKACEYGELDHVRCYQLLSEAYFSHKKYYDKAKEHYEYLFKALNPTKYGYSPDGVAASKILGDMYYQGLGTRQDLDKAKNYYGIACDNKDQDACTLYKEVNEKVR